MTSFFLTMKPSKIDWNLANGPISGRCDRTIRYSGWGVRSVCPVDHFLEWIHHQCRGSNCSKALPLYIKGSQHDHVHTFEKGWKLAKKMESLQDWCFTAAFRHYTGRLSRGATGQVPFMARSCCWANLKTSSRWSATCMLGYICYYLCVCVCLFVCFMRCNMGSTFSYEVKWQIPSRWLLYHLQGAPDVAIEVRIEMIHAWCVSLKYFHQGSPKQYIYSYTK